MSNRYDDNRRPPRAPAPAAGPERELRSTVEAMDALLARLSPLLMRARDTAGFDGDLDLGLEMEIQAVFNEMYQLWPTWKRLAQSREVDQDLVRELHQDLEGLAAGWRGDPAKMH